MRSLAPMTRPLIFEPRPATAELARLIDMPAAPAVFRKSLRPTEPLSSDMCPSRVGLFVILSVALSGGWGLPSRAGVMGVTRTKCDSSLEWQCSSDWLHY